MCVTSREIVVNYNEIMCTVSNMCPCYDYVRCYCPVLSCRVDISVLGPPGVTSNIGSLNPDLYKSPLIPEEDTSNYPEGHLGRFWFSLNYDQDQEKLIINLIRIHNLPSRDKDSTSACDPLVRYIHTLITLHV